MMRAAWGACAGATIVVASGCVPDDVQLAILDSGVPETATATGVPCRTDLECGDSGRVFCLKTFNPFSGQLFSAECTPVPEQCQDAGFDPACGTDGTYYFNRCLAQRARATLSTTTDFCSGFGFVCGDPPARPCPPGSTCERLLLGQPFPLSSLSTNYCVNVPGSCWVVPEACTLRLPRPFVACGTIEPCVDPCTAIADGGLFVWDVVHCLRQ
jgi:hypothetical protein